MTRIQPSNYWIELKLEGVKSNRSTMEACVRVSAGGLAQTAEVRSGGSYLSQSDPRPCLGLGLGEATISQGFALIFLRELDQGRTQVLFCVRGVLSPLLSNLVLDELD